MPYRIAGIDVHKKMLAVAAASTLRSTATSSLNARRSGPAPADLRALARLARRA